MRCTVTRKISLGSVRALAYTSESVGQLGLEAPARLIARLRNEGTVAWSLVTFTDPPKLHGRGRGVGRGLGGGLNLGVGVGRGVAVGVGVAVAVGVGVAPPEGA